MRIIFRAAGLLGKSRRNIREPNFDREEIIQGEDGVSLPLYEKIADALKEKQA